ncbi:MAG: hypothetical protein JWR57_948 [Mycetocola sp.]|nr:hypothetical protein [Mycetocola sp.]
MTLSVALCTHNGERFIGQQLQSILSQTQPPFEIIVSDDASTDSTLNVVEKTLAAFQLRTGRTVPVRLLQNDKPLGVTKNFEQAVKACAGDLIALSDQDDVWLPDRLERAQLAFAARPKLLLLHADARLIDEDGNQLPNSLLEALEVSESDIALIRAGKAFDVLMRRNVVTGATVVLRRALLDIAAPFPTSWVHDEWLAIMAASIGDLDVDLLPVVEYRQHGLNQIGVEKLSTRRKFARLMEPGAERNRRLLARASDLAQRLEDMNGTVLPTRLTAAREKVHHERVRSSLGPARGRRISAVLRELQTGRYSAYGRGLADAVRDLLQPLRPAR